MGVATWLVWRCVDANRHAPIAIAIFAVHFVVNVAWSAAFFGLQSPLAGLVVIVVLLGCILATMAAFARVDRRAAALLLPYLVWVLRYGAELLDLDVELRADVAAGGFRSPQRTNMECSTVRSRSKTRSLRWTRRD